MSLRGWGIPFAVVAACVSGCGNDATLPTDAASGDATSASSSGSGSGSDSGTGSSSGSGSGSGSSSGSGSGSSSGSSSSSGSGSGAGSGSSSGSSSGADAGHDADAIDAHVDGPQNDPKCPAAYGSDGGACPLNASCRYPEGLCDCESPRCGGALLPDASNTPIWRCVSLAPSCPYAIVDSGACAPPGTQCSYGYCCKPTIACTDAGWGNGAPFCPP